MRMTANQHRFERGGREAFFEILEQHANPPRDLTPAQLIYRRTIEAHHTLLWAPQPCQRMQRERLTRAVTAENRRELARAKLDGQLRDELPRAGANAERACGETC